MKVKNKKTIFLLFLIVCTLLSYWLWLSLRPVKVIAVHEEGNHASVLVRNYPITDRGKINWWLENKDRLKDKYNIPKPSSSGYFTIVFWDFGDGYKEEGKYDRRCFSDIKTKVNCIEKNAVFTVNKSRNFNITFKTHDGDNYHLDNRGNITKIKYN